MTPFPGFVEFRYHHDGLTLAGRVYGELAQGAPPIVCLPGLTRNARDFHEFALTVQNGPAPRPVVAFDYRGRGRSEYAATADAYSITHEAGDILAGLRHLAIEHAVFVGTSRGALIIHVLAAMARELIIGAVLNDAGPRIEVEGLRLIRAYVGKTGPFATWDEAIDAIEQLNGAAFPALRRPDFERMARATFIERQGPIVADHDPKLAEGLVALDLDAELPQLWDLFALLKDVPLLTIRGENSRLLANATLTRMACEHTAMESVTVPGQGHAPLLETAGLPERIAAFAARLDRGKRHAG